MVLLRERVYAEIDLSALEHNFRALKALSGRAVMASVKADAYGHGAVPAAKRLCAAGADWLAVATADEGLSLREAGIAAPILILGHTAPQLAPRLCRENITLTCASYEHAARLSQAAAAAGVTPGVHMKLDTGMARLGFGGEDDLAAALALPNLRAEGLFTHFAASDLPGEPFMDEQIQKYNRVLGLLERRGHSFTFTHCANSGAVLHYNKEVPGNMVRAGIALYGYAPSGFAAIPVKLIPVMSLWANVAMVRDLRAGETVSYGRAYKAPRDSRIAVICCGYADGYRRALSGKGHVLLHGRRCAVVGKVCMDMLMADVTDVPEVTAGDTALLFGAGENAPSLDELANLAGTISYELLCAVSARVPRIYQAL
ncbi:MAG: alanine racemase [Oscillospiraceae bacterium]|nr:alanine racemase [Oscillospiraceae bacterium]